MNKKRSSTFVEICIYEVKQKRVDEFEELIKKVIKHHGNFPGVVDVRYMKLTHRPCSFGDAKKGNPSIKLTREPKSYTYALYWELDNEVTHGKATKSGLENYFRNNLRFDIWDH